MQLSVDTDVPMSVPAIVVVVSGLELIFATDPITLTNDACFKRGQIQSKKVTRF